MQQKYFIAIVPPEPLLSEIELFKKEIFETFGTKGALRSPGHITLHMPFLWEETKEEKLITCLQTFRTGQQFDICLKNFNCFEPRVIFIDVEPNEELVCLQKKLVRHVKKNLQLFNQSDDLRGFHPHITIAFRDLKKSVFYSVWSLFKDKKFTATFNCKSVVLLKEIESSWEIYKEFV